MDGNKTVEEMQEQNRILAEQMNDDMRATVMPVTVFVGVEVVLGFFGNLCVLYVFFFRYHNCNFRYFVLCLAFTDITSTLTTMSGEMVTQLYWFIYPVPILCKIKSFFNVFTVSSEALCLLIIAVDRYRKVCAPFKWQIKQRAAMWLCLVLYIVATVVSFPVAIFWGTHDEIEVYKGFNVTVTICEIDHKYVDSSRPLDYSICIEIFLSILLLIMFCVYVLIARKILCRRGRANNYERGRNNREIRMKQKTLIMFILTLAFIVTTVIYTTMLSFIANDALHRLSDSERVVYFLFFRLYFINHVINPIVYGVLDPKFRKAIMKCRTNRETNVDE